MGSVYIAVFGGIVALGLFFIRELIDVLKYVAETKEAEGMMLIIERLADEQAPLSCEALVERVDLRFGVRKRKSVRHTRRLCYRMIKEGTLLYAPAETCPGDVLTRSQVGYILPYQGGQRCPEE